MTAAVRTVASSRRAAARTKALVALLGVGLVAALLTGIGTIYAAFSGDFTNKVTVYAQLPPGQPVDPGNDVQYLGAQVGTVADKGTTLPGGAVQVRLSLKPGSVAAIPANVTATVAPTSLFGKEDVILEAPSPSGRVHAGELISASRQTPASLQGTLTSLDKLLTGLHPAQLDTTLNAMATALDGQGPSMSAAIRQLDGYLQTFMPELPVFNRDIFLLSPLLNGLAQTVPTLLDFAGRFSTTATTLTQDSGLLGQVFSNTSNLAGSTQTFFQAIANSLHATLLGLSPFLLSVSATPNALPRLLGDLDHLATTWAPDVSSPLGPEVTVTGPITGKSAAALIMSGSGILDPTGSTQQVVKQDFGYLDPPVYSAADCPRYGSEEGPNCPGAPPASTTSQTSGSGAQASTASQTSGSTGQASPAPAQTAGAFLSDQDLASLQSIAATLGSGGKPATAGSQSSVDALLLAPVLESILR